MLDRTIAPAASEIAYSEFPQVKSELLKDDLPLHYVGAGEQPVLKLELTFDSGSKYEPQRSVSWLAAKMLMEGTTNKSANQIAETLDSLGAHVDITPGFDQLSISVYCLKKNFSEVLVLLNEMLTDSILPAREFDLLKGNRADQIRMNDKKSSTFASKKIREAFFGPEHYYGLGLTPELVSSVQLEAVKDYYGWKLFVNPEIFLSGDVDDDDIRLVEDRLNFLKIQKPELPSAAIVSIDKIIVEREDALQSSIRIAWKIPAKSATSYFDYQIGNCVLGGYFGSRLMKNIREDKGYTYGISTYPVHLMQASFGILGADVVAERTKDALSEIWKEIERLKNEPISDEELSAVTNYMAGSFMNSINTPFQLMEKFKGIHKFELGYDYYEHFFQRLKSIRASDIQTAVSNTFSQEAAKLVVVGKMI